MKQLNRIIELIQNKQAQNENEIFQLKHLTANSCRRYLRIRLDWERYQLLRCFVFYVEDRKGVREL